ncbi:hypothetical protein HPB50_008900 [Hyalomma asiaticum]|uniref:Uncharacterized protein n=1 Tax=Hyalomma asiaticum TaxID=266040 RepID=A0ACB7RU47_HYAAI|nr:hypothetical protein HPB50_008900 [Hyalomma asiaticum]
MSIIIRLQNLPWVANSLDIRRYFQGLNIPEGGVHIVGGEKGDAFIAFASDEDARQAMERDGGKLKEVRIKLLLSSRAEMQRVIDQARAQHAAPPPVKKEERRRPSPDDRSRRPPRDRSPRRRTSRRDRSHSRSPPYRSRDKDRSRPSRSDERRRSLDDPGRMPESSKVSNGQTSERKSWDEKQAPYSDPSKTAPPIFPIGNANQATRLPGDATSAPVNMAGPPAPLPNLAAFNLPPVSLMNNLSGLAANLMSGLMGTAGADMMGAMTASMGEGLPANMTSNHSSGLAGQIGSMQGSMAANMPGGMAANVTSGMPAAIPSGLAANIPGSMPGPMGGMPTAAGAVTGNVGGGMAAAMPSNIAANMPGAFGMVDAMGAPNMENTRNIAAGVVDRRLDDGGKVDRKNEGVPPGGARDAPRRAEESCCVELRGLSGAPTPRDVKDLFRGLRIFSGCIRVATSETGMKSVVVRFASKSDAREAIHDGMPLNRRDEEPPAARGVGPDSAPEVGHGPLHGMDPAAPAHGVSRSLVPPGHTCISMLGLPNTVTDRDIADFFSVQGVIPRAIHIMLGANGVPTGHAFAEFTNHADCETAFMQDGASLGPHIIALKTIPYSEVAQALGGHHRPDGRPDGRPENRFDGRFPDRGGDGRPGRPGMWPEERFEPGPPGLPHRERDGPPKRPLLERSSRPPLFPEGGPRRGPLFPDHGGPLPDHELPPRGMDSFGKPGCVITATNIPFRAGAEEIINFFQGFDLTKEDVMRRFNEMGHVTGDARIAFRTPRDAQEALAKYNNRPMQGRSISLSIL